MSIEHITPVGIGVMLREVVVNCRKSGSQERPPTQMLIVNAERGKAHRLGGGFFPLTGAAVG